MRQLMRFWFLLCMGASKAQASLRKCAVSKEPSLLVIQSRDIHVDEGLDQILGL